MKEYKSHNGKLNYNKRRYLLHREQILEQKRKKRLKQKAEEEAFLKACNSKEEVKSKPKNPATFYCGNYSDINYICIGCMENEEKQYRGCHKEVMKYAKEIGNKAV